MLLAHPATYYHYEPLIHYGIKQVRSGLLDGLLAEDAIRVLKNVLNCNYNELGRYRNCTLVRELDEFHCRKRSYNFLYLSCLLENGLIL